MVKITFHAGMFGTRYTVEVPGREARTFFNLAEAEAHAEIAAVTRNLKIERNY